MRISSDRFPYVQGDITSEGRSSGCRCALHQSGDWRRHNFIDTVKSGRDLSNGARAVAFFLPAEAEGLVQRLHGLFHSA